MIKTLKRLKAGLSSSLKTLFPSRNKLGMHRLEDCGLESESPHVTLGQTQPQPQVGQTAEVTSGRDPRNVMGLDSRSIDELLKFIEGSEQKKAPKKRPAHSNPKRRSGAAVGAKT